MGKLRGVLLGAALAAAAATACVVTVWWEGSESSITFTWTLNGATPDTASCGAAHGTTVRMWISQALPSCTLDSATCGTWDGGWEWTCTAETGTTGPHFAAVEMYIGWTLLDSTGRVLSYTPWTRYTLQPGDNPLGNVPFATTSLPDASISSTWTLNGAAPDAAACEAAGAANVFLLYRPAGSGTPSEFSFPCASGTGATATVLTSGSAYELRWELRSASGTAITASPSATTWQTLTAVAGSNPFTVPLTVTVGRLDMTFEWGDKVVGPAFGNCTFPPNDVASMGYSLETTTGTVVQSVDITTAPIPCATSMAWVGVPFGSYNLHIDGVAATGATTWATDCTGISVSALTGASFSCQVLMTVAK
jgi:hypothetical protein